MINYPKATIAIIGGSGLYEMEGLTGAEPVNVDTPYGNPSDAIMVGELDGVSVAFLPRHGKATGLIRPKFPSRQTSMH